MVRLIVGTLLVVTSLSAQRRFDITPLFGYRGAEGFPVSPGTGSDESGGKARFASGAAFGVSAGFRYEDLNVIEFNWVRQSTDLTYSNQGGVAIPFRTNARLDQFHGDFTREYDLQDHPLIRPFIMGSVGATRVTTAASSFTRMSFGLGGGIKLFFTPRFGFRLQAQWLPLWLNPKVEGFACGGGCVVVLGGRIAHQGQVSLGPIFSF